MEAYKIILPNTKVKNKEVPVLSLRGEVIKNIGLPPIFSYPVRLDLIRRAFHSAHTARIQPKGRDPLAGKRRTGESWGINHSVARVPRLDNGRAVFAPMTRGGRLAHPPRVEKVIHEEINKKERVRAIVSAIAATSLPEFVRKRGHIFSSETLPLIVVDEIEEVDKTAYAKRILNNLGVLEDVIRASERRRVRAGRGKMRGRRYITPKSILLVVSKKSSLAFKSFRNLPGVDVVPAEMLSILHLAPGGVAGRLTLYTESALNALGSKYEVIQL